MSNRDWATTPELRSLIAKALSNGADDWIVSTETRTLGFLAEKERLQRVYQESNTDNLYMRKYYVLSNLRHPVNMLLHGVRDHIVTAMAGRLIGGSLFCQFLPSYGQCVVISATGKLIDLRKLEGFLDSNIDYWSWESNTIHYPDCQVNGLNSYTFTIEQSIQGAVSDVNSDFEYDNVSETKSQQSGSTK